MVSVIGSVNRHVLTGQSFGRLTVTDRSEIRGRRRVYWLCRCQCGKEKWVIADALKSGLTKSCGCLNDQVRREQATHGATRDGKHSPEYTVWHSMKQRCGNPKNLKFALYGGRGIAICKEWENSFEQFLIDMGPRPPGKTIDRFPDLNGNYEPGNCRWATYGEQNRNTARNHMITFAGQTMCLTDWATRIGIKPNTLSHRLTVWPLDRALQRASQSRR